MKGGSVQFSSSTDPATRVVGLILDNGTFTLHTILDRSRSSGAPEGEYSVSVIPPLEGGRKGLPPIPVPGTFKIGPGEANTFKLEVDSPPPAS